MDRLDCTLGVDMGTTAVKVVAFDTAGRELARAALPLLLLQETPGAAEQDPASLVAAVRGGIATVARQVSEHGRRVARVGFSAAMHSLIPVGWDGQPLMRAMTWADLRAKREADALWASALGEALYARTGAPIHPMTPLAKLLWLRTARPDVFHKAARYVSLQEWVWHDLFDEWCINASLASATGLYNLATGDWDKQALAVAQISPEQLSTIVPTTYTRTHAPVDTVQAIELTSSVTFTTGASDGVLANLGVGATTSDLLCLTVGTSMAVRMGTTAPVTDVETRHFCYILDEGRYIIGGPSNNGGLALNWLYRSVLATASHGTLEMPPDPRSGDAERDLSEWIAAAADAQSGKLLFLPYVAGERAPLWNSDATGALLGLNLTTTGVEIMRAAIEGIIFNAYWLASRLFAGSASPSAIVASGGVLQHTWIRQLVADIFGLPVLDSGAADASARGAALIAEIATGETTWNDASLSVSRIHISYPESTAHSTYQRTFRRFRSLAQSLNGELAALYQGDAT